jgi:paired amphipathic helix protein Sin3a
MHIGDVDVVFDVLKLIFSYLDRATTSYAAKERLAIENTLRRFVPLLFNISEKDVEATLAPAITFGEDGEIPETDAAESDADDTGAASDTGATSEASGQSTPAALKKGKKTVADLRKKLLTSAINGQNGPHTSLQEDGVADSSEEKSGETAGDKITVDDSSWISASPVPWPAGPSTTPPKLSPRSPSKMKSRAMPSPRAGSMPEAVKTALQDSAVPRYNCFVSQPFYCFIRLFHVSLAFEKHEKRN